MNYFVVNRLRIFYLNQISVTSHQILYLNMTVSAESYLETTLLSPITYWLFLLYTYSEVYIFPIVLIISAFNNTSILIILSISKQIDSAISKQIRLYYIAIAVGDLFSALPNFYGAWGGK